MAAEPTERDHDDWLDGLAGRPGEGEHHRQGQTLRAAFDSAPAVDPAPLPWEAIEQEAARRSAQRPAQIDIEAQPAIVPRTAANDDGSRRWWPAAAAVLLAVGLWATLAPREVNRLEQPVMRGDAQRGAVWLVATPEQEAQQLAEDLRRLGATVVVTPSSDPGATGSLVLFIKAPESDRAEVNRRLSSLETALGQDGELQLTVKSR